VPAATYPEFALQLPVAPPVSRRVRRLGLDVFHAHHPFLLGPAARRLARRAGRPLVFTYHTRYEKYAHYVPVRRPLVEAAAIRLSSSFAASAAGVIAPSQAVRQTLAERGVGASVEVIPTGVDVASFRPGDAVAARRRLALAPADPVLLYVGRLDREKSVDRLLLAFAHVQGTVPHARLILVGHGTETARLQALARTLPAAGRIAFLPARPHADLPVCYQAADVFLFASETETQGLVVSVTGPGCDEVVRDGETGLLTKAEPPALAEAAISLLLDGQRRRWMGRRAREIAERDFDVRLQIDQTVALYARVCRLG
jgi:1,2-diacylglycerol 3-alpha-glucosyltransferase